MKKSKRILSAVLVLALAMSLLVIPASADSGEPQYPNIFVHGLFGWGERDDVNALLPYWGLSNGSALSYLRSKGYECYGASVGPLSSAWDRACELYAQLLGQTVDYGVAHSQEKEHDRFGITYENALVPDWSAEKKINLIGHSFGGATVRLFLQILAEGCPEELAAAEAAGVEPSDFFRGGKGDWVYSITTLAAPHNGTTFIESNSFSTEFVNGIFLEIGKAIAPTDLKGLYDFQLDQFGIKRNKNESMIEAYTRIMQSDFMSHNDNAIYDLTIDNALVLNDGIDIQENVYYFSYAGDKSYKTVFGTYAPEATMFPLFMPFSINIGKYYDKYTAGGVYIDRDWLPNDGMVNTLAALYPANSELLCLKKDGSTGYVHVDGSEKFEKGIWNVMPVQRKDHLGIIGGLFSLSETLIDTRLFYLELMHNIDSTYGSGESSDWPFIDVGTDRWSYEAIRKLYELGAISGRSETIFDPTGKITRAEFVTILANIDNADMSLYADCRFADVPEGYFAAPCIEWAAENGIVYGYDEAHFGPEDCITRQDMAAIICRYCEYAGVSLASETEYVPYADEAEISDYALEYVVLLQKSGVMVGEPDGCFAPKRNASREEACAALCGI